jgi:hypothetical protein
MYSVSIRNNRPEDPCSTAPLRPRRTALVVPPALWHGVFLRHIAAQPTGVLVLFAKEPVASLVSAIASAGVGGGVRE